MTKIRSGGPKASHTKAASNAQAKKPASKSAEAKKASSTQFPRAAWKDSNKLETAITKNKDQLGLNDTHPRLQHAKADKKHTHPNRPPIVMRYGVIRPPVDNGGGNRPPVVMRYGVIRPPVIDDGNGNRPPIAMRYGLIRPR